MSRAPVVLLGYKGLFGECFLSCGAAFIPETVMAVMEVVQEASLRSCLHSRECTSEWEDEDSDYGYRERPLDLKAQRE